MATTTNLWTIRDTIVTKIEALTPSLLPGAGMEFRRVPNLQDLRTWAESAGSIAFRKFEVRRDPEQTTNEPVLMDPDAYERTEWLRITVAYPVLPGLYGNSDHYDIEKVMRSDAGQIRTVVFNPTNYVAGQSLAFPTIQPPDQSNPQIWFQGFSVELTYTEAQVLG